MYSNELSPDDQAIEASEHVRTDPVELSEIVSESIWAVYGMARASVKKLPKGSSARADASDIQSLLR